VCLTRTSSRNFYEELHFGNFERVFEFPFSTQHSALSTQHSALSIQHSAFQHCHAALALILLNLGGGLRAQTNSEYGFIINGSDNGVGGIGLNDGTSYDPGGHVPELTMDGLAANGIGQWTMSQQAGVGSEYPAGWYLLENALREPEKDASGLQGRCIPPGVVANGTFSSASKYSPMQPKVTANLDGSVCYVFPSAGITCSGGLITTKKGGIIPEATKDDTISSTFCSHILSNAYQWNSDGNTESETLAYDTMRYYITHCYLYANPIDAFGQLGLPLDSEGSMQAALNLRGFLIDALKLRSDDAWFCRDVFCSIGTYRDPSLALDRRDQLSILKFLIDNPRCGASFNEFSRDYSDIRASDYQNWQDTANGYPWIHETYDTTLPSMHELGLDSVLFYASVGHYETLGSQIISNAELAPNPTMDRASLTLDIEREAYVHIEVFDLLGRKLEGIGYQGVFEPGPHQTLLDLKSLPSGSYYVHIATANNEVRTIKLVKE
jgi:hypothetical protein